MNKIDVIKSASSFYKRVIDAVDSSSDRITIITHALVDGRWSRAISKELVAKARSGVEINIYTSTAGFVFENWKKIPGNVRLYKHLRENGICLHLFPDLFYGKGLHTKLVVVDDRVLFLGGSNIADHYLDWVDTNFEIKGAFDKNLHIHLEKLFGNRGYLFKKVDLGKDLTLGYQSNSNKKAFESELANLIIEAKEYLRIATWYFWPSPKIEKSLLQALDNGVKVEIMYSVRNRFPIIDPIRGFYTKRLKEAGALFHYWVNGFNHSKLYWNEKSFVVGSPNLDYFALNFSEEVFVRGHDTDKKTIAELNEIFDLWVPATKS